MNAKKYLKNLIVKNLFKKIDTTEYFNKFIGKKGFKKN